MNILYTIGWPLGQGGHVNSTYMLISDLIDMYKTSKMFLIAPRGEKVDMFKSKGVEYIPIKNYDNRLIFAIALCYKVIKVKFRHKIDIIHCMDLKSLLGGLIVSVFSNHKLIFTKAGGKPQNFGLPRLSSLIVFSEELFDNYIQNRHFFKPDRMFLIKERILIPTNKIIVEKKNNYSDKIVLFIAMRLVYSKKGLLDNLFKELSLMKSTSRNIIINIAGDGDLINYCISKAKSLEENSRGFLKFNFLGELNNNDEIMFHNQNSNLIVGHGRGILEAMAVGKPVVLLGFDEVRTSLVNESNINNIAKYNFSGRNLIIDDKTKSLAHAISSLFNKIHSLDNIGEFNKRYIEKEYDSKIGAKKTQKIYLESKLLTFNDKISNVKWLIMFFLRYMFSI